MYAEPSEIRERLEAGGKEDWRVVVTPVICLFCLQCI